VRTFIHEVPDTVDETNAGPICFRSPSTRGYRAGLRRERHIYLEALNQAIKRSSANSELTGGVGEIEAIITESGLNRSSLREGKCAFHLALPDCHTSSGHNTAAYIVMSATSAKLVAPASPS
jgi:hypothetical protein